MSYKPNHEMYGLVKSIFESLDCKVIKTEHPDFIRYYKVRIDGALSIERSGHTVITVRCSEHDRREISRLISEYNANVVYLYTADTLVMPEGEFIIFRAKLFDETKDGKVEWVS